MKLPRDLSAADLEKALRREFVYECVRQVGSHRRLVTQAGGEHRLTIPWHDPLRVGTLRGILAEIMQHHDMTLDSVLRKLGLA